MINNSGTYFEHDPSVIAYAYTLVKEYDDHEKAESRKFKKKHPEHAQLIKKREAERKAKRRSEL